MFEVWNITPDGPLKSNHRVHNNRFATRHEAEIALDQCNKIQLDYLEQMQYEIREVFNEEDSITKSSAAS